MERLLLDARSAAAALGGITTRHLYNLVQQYHIPKVKLGRRTFFRPEDLKEFIQRVATEEVQQ